MTAPRTFPSLDQLAENPAAALLSVRAVGALLSCSERHVRRLSLSGRMPQPVRIGSLVRWRREEIEEWIAAGCPPRTEVKKPPRKYPVDIRP
ncbi:MAG: helix-turn-helix domain-containing protein [Planctomycetes bacterium]|nr:helix-turn-helix domain-containing protein [Planctomycetota bacterium]